MPNSHDERLTMPIPPDCRTCRNREQWITKGVERNRCLKGRPMHADCAWYAPVTPSIDTATTKESA